MNNKMKMNKNEQIAGYIHKKMNKFTQFDKGCTLQSEDESNEVTCV